VDARIRIVGVTEPSGATSADFIANERDRMRAAYQLMPLTLTPELYAPWQPAEMLMRFERMCVAARNLRRLQAFPTAQDQCLEVGFGTRGWLADLMTWGIAQKSLHGMEIDDRKVQVARECLPGADLRVGDATSLPWGDGTFRLVIASTVLSSILDERVRRALAREIVRVLARGGALVCYDFTVASPRNPHVRRVTRSDLRDLFPDLHGRVQSVTLAPPLARLVAGRAWTLALLLQTVPLLRTHLLAVLVKK
jgi:ubiquinone/menaquinone biosynthesis C-methylase UbiE